MKKSIRFLFAFALAASVGYSASEAQARIKQRCVDPACVAQCQAAGGSNCFNMCVVGCDD